MITTLSVVASSNAPDAKSSTPPSVDRTKVDSDESDKSASSTDVKLSPEARAYVQGNQHSDQPRLPAHEPTYADRARDFLYSSLGTASEYGQGAWHHATALKDQVVAKAQSWLAPEDSPSEASHAKPDEKKQDEL